MLADSVIIEGLTAAASLPRIEYVFDIGSDSGRLPQRRADGPPITVAQTLTLLVEHVPRAGGRYRGAGRRTLWPYQMLADEPQPDVFLADLADGGSDGWSNRGVENAGDDVARIQLVRRDLVGNGVGCRVQHLVGDVAQVAVEQPAEEPRESEHVVDLIGEVASPGGHDSRMLLRLHRVDFRDGVGQPEDDRILGHVRHVLAVEQVGSRDSDEDVSADQHLLEEPVRFSGLVFSTSQRRMSDEPSGASYTAPLLSQPMIMVAPCRFSSRMIADPAAPTPEMTNLTLEMSLRTTRNALISAASTTIAVPC